jgi:hypothetical protein
VPQLGQLALELDVVVDLAVEHHPAAAPPEGLIGPLVQVQDAQAGVQQVQVPAIGRLEVLVPLVVGTAPAHLRQHLVDATGRQGARDESGDATHGG